MPYVDTNSRSQRTEGHPARAIAALAARQGGAVSRAQLIERGLSPRAIQHRLSTGRLHLVHRGAYAAGHARLGATGRRPAALLCGGTGAALVLRSEAALWVCASHSGRSHLLDLSDRIGHQRLVRLLERADRLRLLDVAASTTRSRVVLGGGACGSARR